MSSESRMYEGVFECVLASGRVLDVPFSVVVERRWKPGHQPEYDTYFEELSFPGETTKEERVEIEEKFMLWVKRDFEPSVAFREET